LERVLPGDAGHRPAHPTELDLPRANDIRISDMAPVVRAADDAVELVQMKWGFPLS
jgi:putative SOS response-associated peptidase YedK